MRDRSMGVRVESKRFGGCEMIRDDVGVLRRAMEMYGSKTKTIVAKGDDEIRRTIGSRARTRFEEVRDDSQNFGLRLGLGLKS